MEKLFCDKSVITGQIFKLIFCILSLVQIGIAAPADLDPTFGSGGKVNTTLSGNGAIRISSMALQTDGKIVVAGYGITAGSSTADFFVARYNSNGTLDTTFSEDGQVFTDFNGGNDGISAMAIQPDGKIVAVGTGAEFAVVRYNSDGSLDTTFDGDGKLTVSFDLSMRSPVGLKIPADGKILIGGFTFNTATFNSNLILVKFNSSGSPDASFGSGGRSVHDFPDTLGEVVTDMTLQPDGRILLSGYYAIEARTFGYISRFESNGSLVGIIYATGFTESPSTISAITTRADGRIIGVGKRANVSFGVELGASGTLNGSLAVPSPNNADYKSVVAQPNGKIVAVGNRNGQFTTIRYNSRESLDTTFGNGGITNTTIVNGLSEEATEVLIQPDGKILVAGSSTSGGNNYSVSLVRYMGDFTAPAKTAFDYDGDRKADISVFRPSNNTWYLSQSSAGFYGLRFGAATDKLTPADYDGDGKTDISVFRDGTWFTIKSSDGTLSVAYFGQAGDIPVPNDYDGDNKADVAVYRSGIWYLNRSTAGFAAVAFGNATDKTVSGDFDGDNKADIAVYRNGIWYYLRSSDNNFVAVSFGTATDKTVPADYDGDGKTDIAVYREGNWYLNRSTGGFGAVSFGNSTDIPTPADYDGDGKADQAVFRDGNWYLLRSANGFTGQLFGFATDKPIPAVFIQ